MKFTIVTGPFGSIPPYTIGAVEKVWFSVGKEWEKLGHNVTFVAKHPGMEAESGDCIFIKGYDRTGSWFKDLWLDLLYSYRAIKTSPKSDVIVLNSIWSPVWLRFFNKARVSAYNVARFPKKQMQLYSNIDCLCCVSTIVKKELIEQSPSLEKQTYMVSNLIDCDIFRMESKRIVSKNPTIVYTGRVHREKGLDILVMALNELNKDNLNVNLKIIGARDEKHGGSGEQYVKELNDLATHFEIIWIDPIYNPEELARQLRECDIFVYPSLAEKGETFGVSPLEAMGCGLPTIVSGLLCFRDFIEDGKNGYVFDHKKENPHLQLARQIKELINNPELFKQFSENGNTTSRKFSAENIAQDYMNLFSRKLKEKELQYKK